MVNRKLAFLAFLLHNFSVSHCNSISCPALFVSNADPPTGICSSADLSYQTYCSFKCLAGYQLKGSEVRVCQHDKTWSGTPSTCEEIRCPPLPFVSYATVIPSNCNGQSMRFSSVCTFSCPDGFTTDVTAPQTASRSLTCQLTGEWDAQAPQCRDYQSPTLSCPGPHIIGDTTKGKSTGKVSWNIQVTDNSVIVDPNAEIIVYSTHQPSQELPIGATGVQVTALDFTGNTATCSFMVYIKDIEAPIIKQCPGDIVREEEDREVRVHWTRPVFSDNSGSVAVVSNRQIGELFAVPGTYQIVYTANDPSNNQNKNCSFRITLKKKSCPLYPPPKNGALACVSNGGDNTCAVMCQTGTDFEFNVPLLYFCSAGQWNFYSLPRMSFSSTLPWPNCKAGVNPSSSIKSWSEQYHYFDGDAHDLNVQVSIKDKFYQLLTAPYVPPFFCLFNPSSCSQQDIFVSPGIKG